MPAVALIVFREVLEAALIVAIIMAATRGLRHRGWWVGAGIGAGILASGLVAMLTNAIAGMFEGTGQEIVNASILFIAVGLISWHVVWMNSHGRQMAAEIKQVGKQVSEGEKHLSILAIVIGLAVMREGAEIVLMLHGLWASGSVNDMLGGGLLGLAGGVLMGGFIYAGFLVFSIQRVFSLTNGLLILIAAGMAARGANFLAQANLIPSLGTGVWDTSHILSEQSVVGQFCAALVGYIARPSGIEILFYTLTVLAVGALMFLADKNNRKILNIVAMLLIGVVLCNAKSVHAESVTSPYITKGEFEFEQKGFITKDDDPSKSDERELEWEIGYNPTEYWHTEIEIEGKREKGPGEEFKYDSFAFENIFSLAQPGQFWVDPAVLIEFKIARDDEPNAVKTGLLLAKNFGPVLNTLNLYLEKEFSPDHSPLKFKYGNQMKYRLRQWFEPGFEIFGNTDGKSKFEDQEMFIGPGIFGKVFTTNAQAIKYELGYLYGVTRASPAVAVRFKVEYEWYF